MVDVLQFLHFVSWLLVVGSLRSAVALALYLSFVILSVHFCVGPSIVYLNTITFNILCSIHNGRLHTDNN